MGKRIEHNGKLSTMRKNSLLPKLGLGILVICALAFGMYIAVDHDKPVADAVTNGSENTGVHEGEGLKGPSQADMEKARAFVREQGLDEKFWVSIDKGSFLLSTWKGEEFISSYTVAVGENSGNKQRVGDRRTPEGTFKVERIQDSRAWVHDFGDGNGPIEHAYGPWFIRLETGWNGIGIHGTHDPSTLGRMVTEGCIRMNNEALLEIVDKAVPGTVVLIRP